MTDIIDRIDTTDLDAGAELPPLAPGTKFHMTPSGFRTLESELKSLWYEERPETVRTVDAAAGNGERSENAEYQDAKRRLRQLDRRAQYIQQRLENAVVVDPANQPNRDQVFFGATVTYVNGRDEEKTVTLVGEDEAAIGDGKINWQSPVGRALLKASVGDEVDVRIPSGVDTIEVLAISYPDEADVAAEA